VIHDQVTLQNNQTNNNKQRVHTKQDRAIATFQKIKGTNIVINKFNYDSIQNINSLNKSIHFLTHFRFDHYIGIESEWNVPIYCSQITANLSQKMLNLNESILCPLPMNKKILIPRSNPLTFVTLFDANNYIKGSVNLLFEITNNRNVQKQDKNENNLKKIVNINGQKNMSLHNWLIADDTKEQSVNNENYEIGYV